MVTKRNEELMNKYKCLILAKIHMVTKLLCHIWYNPNSLILAKIHMVTKLNWVGGIR